MKNCDRLFQPQVQLIRRTAMTNMTCNMNQHEGRKRKCERHHFQAPSAKCQDVRADKHSAAGCKYTAAAGGWVITRNEQS